MLNYLLEFYDYISFRNLGQTTLDQYLDQTETLPSYKTDFCTRKYQEFVKKRYFPPVMLFSCIMIPYSICISVSFVLAVNDLEISSSCVLLISILEIYCCRVWSLHHRKS